MSHVPGSTGSNEIIPFESVVYCPTVPLGNLSLSSTPLSGFPVVSSSTWNLTQCVSFLGGSSFLGGTGVGTSSGFGGGPGLVFGGGGAGNAAGADLSPGLALSAKSGCVGFACLASSALVGFAGLPAPAAPPLLISTTLP